MSDQVYINKYHYKLATTQENISSMLVAQRLQVDPAILSRWVNGWQPVPSAKHEALLALLPSVTHAQLFTMQDGTAQRAQQSRSIDIALHYMHFSEDTAIFLHVADNDVASPQAQVPVPSEYNDYDFKLVHIEAIYCLDMGCSVHAARAALRGPDVYDVTPDIAALIDDAFRGTFSVNYNYILDSHDAWVHGWLHLERIYRQLGRPDTPTQTIVPGVLTWQT